MSGPARADELVAEISDLVPANVSVTADPLTIPAALSNGQPVIVIQPPDLAFPTFTATEATWELYVIAGPFDDTRRAWDTMAALIDALTVPLALDTAKPASFAAPNMPQYPAYVLTFSETT